MRKQVALYLDDVHVEMLAKLAHKTGRTQQELLREAVNTLLVEYRMFNSRTRKSYLRRRSVTH